jgi:hypothetical protein
MFIKITFKYTCHQERCVDDNTKLLITGTIYSILLLIIFGTFINKALMFLLESFYPKPSTTGQGLGINIMPIPIIPTLAVSIIALVIAVTMTYAVIRLVRVQRINEFLKPNKFKINTTIVILAFILVLAIIQAFGVFNAVWYSILMNVLTFVSSIFDGTGLFMVWLFPMIVYYLIVCWIYNRDMKAKEMKRFTESLK